MKLKGYFYNILEFMVLRLGVLVLGLGLNNYLVNMNYFFKNFLFSICIIYLN